MGLLELVFPAQCLACPRVLDGPSHFCDACGPGLEPLPEPMCRRCGEPGRHPGSECRRCRTRPPPFTRAFAPFSHHGAIARAIHLFKYEDRPDLARPLAHLVAQTAAAFLARAPRLFCPIPLHPARAQKRRYDQARLFAHELARATGGTCLPFALERIRPTRRQVGLPEPERETNVAGAFRTRRDFRGAAVLLVDDVFTTGATARAAAQALCSAGARAVHALAIARAHGA